MRKTLFFIILVAAGMMIISSTGCTDSKPSATSADSTAAAQDDSTAADTLEQILEATPMPKAADELFDDFFFNFAGNRKLQKSRIDFPLPVISRNDTAYVEQKRWKTEHFFMNQGYYTLIFDNMRQMDVVKDTTVSNVVVERISLARKSVRQFVFNRVAGQWRMRSVVVTGLEKNRNASFLKFYHRFVTDTLFQISSINDPLDFTGPNPDDDFSTMSGIIAPEQWLSFAPELPGDNIYNIVYGNASKEGSQKIFVIRGISNGLETELTFQKKRGEWKLIRLIM